MDRLDEAQQVALRLGWDAFRTGNIGVGAVVTGTSLAHAQINALATIPFRAHERELVLTTTLQPCLQCSAAIRMAPIALVRVLGPDPLWDGCDDLTSLTPWIARRPPVPVEWLPQGEVATFSTSMARCSPFSAPPVDGALREGPLLDLADRLRAGRELEVLGALPVEDALERLWPRLSRVCAELARRGRARLRRPRYPRG